MERGVTGMAKRRVAGIAERVAVEKGVVGTAERRASEVEGNRGEQVSSAPHPTHKNGNCSGSIRG
jgi:hypothetical protein